MLKGLAAGKRNERERAEHSTLAGLANVEDIKREMEAVLKIDEGFQAGSAYMALGQVYMQAPRLLGGDPSNAIQYLEKGQKFGPDKAMLRLRLAEAYQAVRRVACSRAFQPLKLVYP